MHSFLSNSIRICLILFASSCFAQGNTYITRGLKTYNTFQVGFIGATDLCYRTLENTRDQPSIQHIVDKRNKDESVKFGYSAGIGIAVNISEHFGMETGVLYSNKGYQTKMTNYIFPGGPEPGFPVKGKSVFTFHYIDIPLKANFFIGKGKLKFYTSFGVITNVLVAEEETFVKKYGDGHTEYNNMPTNFAYNKVVFSGMVAAGIDWRVNAFMHLRAAPYFSHNIGRIIDTDLSTYLWTAGMQVSYYFGI